MNFTAKEQRIPDLLETSKDVNSYPNKCSWDPSYAKYLQKVRAENKIGLNKMNSFNWDKYGRKPPTHQYKLMGDVLRRPSQSALVSVMSLSQVNDLAQMDERVGDYNQKRFAKWKERKTNQVPLAQSSVEVYGGVRLSTNIKHKYGKFNKYNKKKTDLYSCFIRF